MIGVETELDLLRLKVADAQKALEEAGAQLARVKEEARRWAAPADPSMGGFHLECLATLLPYFPLSGDENDPTMGMSLSQAREYAWSLIDMWLDDEKLQPENVSERDKVLSAIRGLYS